MLNNSLTEFAFHQAALTGYVIPSGQRPRVSHGEESGVHVASKNRLSTLDSALRATLRVRNDMCARHARRFAYILFIENLSTNYLTPTGMTDLSTLFIPRSRHSSDVWRRISQTTWIFAARSTLDPVNIDSRFLAALGMTYNST